MIIAFYIISKAKCTEVKEYKIYIKVQDITVVIQYFLKSKDKEYWGEHVTFIPK